MGQDSNDILPPKKPPEFANLDHRPPKFHKPNTAESNITLPSNINIRDSATNLKKAITGKLNKQKRVVKPRIEDHPYKKVSLTGRAETQRIPPSQVQRTVSKLTSVKLPPLPAKTRPRRPENAGSDDIMDHDMVQNIRNLLKISSPMRPSSFKFEATEEAAIFNFKLLKTHDFHLERLLHIPPNSVTAYGSEFKTADQLEPLLGHHHRWQALQERLEQGADFPLAKISEETRQKDFDAAFQRGNHKSATTHLPFLASALKGEVEKGWAIIIKKEDARHYPKLELAPMGVAEQTGISATGEFVTKKRITHDLSYPGAFSGQSVNSRVDDSLLEPCMFGHTLLRVVHRIVHFRIRNPNKIVWIRKEDFKSAYRRVHLRASSATTSAVSIEFDNKLYVLIPLRLPFGGAPCPSDFCVISDVITDTINDLMENQAWIPADVHSNYVSHIPAAIAIKDDIPFVQGRPLSVTLPANDNGAADCFVDDIITIAVDVDDNLQRATAAPCTVIHALAHSSSTHTSVIRQNMIADDKNEAEGGPEERKICLGWLLDTRRLLVILPSHKFVAWTLQTNAMIKQKTANNADLSSLLGRLEHVAIVIPMFAHFLNNIRTLQITASTSDHNVRINARTKTDLRLSLIFLRKAEAGVSMNLITFRSPDKIYINDASEHGLGGFATHGRAWRWHIPSELQGRAHINLLEFLAQLISIWIDIIEGTTKAQDCLLGMGDSTAAMGWLRRSNFREAEESDNEWLVKQDVARKVAEVVLQADAVLYRQWFRGEDNVVADSLSRDCFFLSPIAHEHFLFQTTPSQLPRNFKILPVPAEIDCFISSTLARLPVQQLRCKPQKPSDLARSKIGALSSIASDWKNQSILTDSPNSNKTYSWQRSHKLSEKHPSLEALTNLWWKAQSVPPSHMWLRPSGQTTGRTPDWTLTVKCASSSRSNCEPTVIKTAHEKNKKSSR